jgi:hypothetical protein
MQEQTHQTQDVTQLKSPYPSPVQKQDQNEAPKSKQREIAKQDDETVEEESARQEQGLRRRQNG